MTLPRRVGVGFCGAMVVNYVLLLVSILQFGYWTLLGSVPASMWLGYLGLEFDNRPRS